MKPEPSRRPTSMHYPALYRRSWQPMPRRRPPYYSMRSWIPRPISIFREQMRTYREALRDRKGRLERVFAYNYDERERPSGVVFVAPRGLRHVQDVDELAAAPSTESDELGSAAGYAQPLDEHSNEVAACARHFGRRAGLGEAGTADLALAAYLHDAGKADPRFQAHHRRWRVPKGGENAKHSSRQSIRRAHVPWWRWRRRPGSRS